MSFRANLFRPSTYTALRINFFNLFNELQDKMNKIVKMEITNLVKALESKV
jgi:hypothetical protein